MSARAFLLLIWLFCAPAFAGSLTITAGITFAVTDTSCAAVKVGASAELAREGLSKYVPTACSSDPVGAGDVILMVNTSVATVANPEYWRVASISASAPSLSLSSLNAAILAMQANGQDMSVLSSAILSIQNSVASLQSTVSGLQTAVAALQSGTSSGGGSSQQFDYVAAGFIFSFFFSFTVGVWVVSKNMGLILNAIRRW